MNIFCFTGHLGADAETRYTPQGQPVAGFSVAVKQGYGDRQTTLWINCQLWGKRAEGGLIPYLTKGQSVAGTGELSVREYDKRDGSKGFAVEVRVIDVDLTGNRNTSVSQNSGHGTQSPQRQQPAAQVPQDAFDDGDDIPF
jgi:single-strand DNA-binding protein